MKLSILSFSPQSVLILSLPETPVPIATVTISDMVPRSIGAWPLTDKYPAVHLGGVVFSPGLDDQVATHSDVLTGRLSRGWDGCEYAGRWHSHKS